MTEIGLIRLRSFIACDYGWSVPGEPSGGHVRTEKATGMPAQDCAEAREIRHEHQGDPRG
jgi:hypothetical protein